jgi:hypothetical protein
MADKLFHQCGHNSKWNIDSLEEDGCGDGLILSPVHQKLHQIVNLDKTVRSQSLFDPQFYLPNSQKNSLKTYPFFPETIGKGTFSTDDFTLVSYQAAQQCIEFQITNGFSHIVIPTRYFDQMYPDFTDRQDSYTVHPFLKALTHRKIKKPIYLTLPLTAHMIINKPFRTQILNWVTSFPEISGVYVMAAPLDVTKKQIQSEELMFSYLEFLRQLRKADLEVVVGYCNTEALLFLLVEGCDITFGTFENTRMFSIDKFVISDEERRGPRARIFSGGLLNWIQLSHAKEIMEENEDIWEKIYDSTPAGDYALNLPKEPNFNQPSLYNHHFMSFSKLISSVTSLSALDRYQAIRAMLKKAADLYQQIADLPLDLEPRNTHTALAKRGQQIL